MRNGLVSVGVLVTFFAAGIGSASAQTPRLPPAKGFIFHDQRQVDRFVVQRWVSEVLPEVSASGFCECMTVVYEGNRKILTLGSDEGTIAVASSGRDVTGDGRAELIVKEELGRRALLRIDQDPLTLSSLRQRRREVTLTSAPFSTRHTAG